MISVNELSPGELAALLHFHAEAGVEWLLEEEAVDRFAEFDAMKAARRNAAAGTQSESREASPRATAQTAQKSTPEPERPAPRPQPSIPDGEAVQQARFAAESARSLPELKTAIEAFNGCNLKHSARSTIFASGDATSGIMVIGSAPGADDDREGQPFAGRPGQLLDKMLAAIGLQRDAILLTQVIPWRPRAIALRPPLRWISAARSSSAKLRLPHRRQFSCLAILQRGCFSARVTRFTGCADNGGRSRPKTALSLRLLRCIRRIY